MSREFRLKYDELRDGDPTKIGSSSESNGSNEYYAESHGHNICFVWLDGKRFFLNYSYMLGGEFKIHDEKNQVKLIFTSHIVQLNGYLLHQLFIDLFEHLPKIIYQIDSRYVLNDVSQPTVTEILVEERG